jgi:hypothetical protein
MEGTIRPFEGGDITPKPVVGGVFQQVSKNSVLAFGKSGGGKSATLSESASITSYMTKAQKELVGKKGTDKANSRDVHKKIVYANGAMGDPPGPNPGANTPPVPGKLTSVPPKSAFTVGGDPPVNASWIEVTRSDDLTVEGGQGPDYQKTEFAYDWPTFTSPTNNDVEYTGTPNKGRKSSPKELTNPDGVATINMNLLDQLTVEVGRGFDYQKTIHSVDNTDANDKRKTHVREITGSDGTSKINIEIIDELLAENGVGFDYQGTKFKFSWEPDMAKDAVGIDI